VVVFTSRAVPSIKDEGGLSLGQFAPQLASKLAKLGDADSLSINSNSLSANIPFQNHKPSTLKPNIPLPDKYSTDSSSIAATTPVNKLQGSDNNLHGGFYDDHRHQPQQQQQQQQQQISYNSAKSKEDYNDFIYDPFLILQWKIRFLPQKTIL